MRVKKVLVMDTIFVSEAYQFPMSYMLSNDKNTPIMNEEWTWIDFWIAYC